MLSLIQNNIDIIYSLKEQIKDNTEIIRKTLSDSKYSISDRWDILLEIEKELPQMSGGLSFESCERLSNYNDGPVSIERYETMYFSDIIWIISENRPSFEDFKIGFEDYSNDWYTKFINLALIEIMPNTLELTEIQYDELFNYQLDKLKGEFLQSGCGSYKFDW